MPIRTDVPATNGLLRAEIYNGAVFRVPATASSRRLVADVAHLVEAHIDENPRQAQFRLAHEDFVAAVGTIKQCLKSGDFQNLIRLIQLDVGFDPEQNAFDALRFRAVPHGAHERENSAPAFIYHRDTWFANPQAQVNWWIPLYDVTEAETFSLYPDLFTIPLANSSGNFDYDDRTAKVGFNNSYANPGQAALYPTVTVPEFDTGSPLTFSSAAGDIILFSGAHLHRTNGNMTGHTRFSVDFRTVNLEDKWKDRGAPNVDNRSRGDATRDFIYPSFATGNTR